MKNKVEGFTKICKLSDLKEKIGKRFFVDDGEIALFKVNSEIFAFSNICPHQKTHLMHEGYIENDKLICPVHAWQFDLKTGNLEKGRKGIDIYEIKIVDEDVFVKIFRKVLYW